VTARPPVVLGLLVASLALGCGRSNTGDPDLVKGAQPSRELGVTRSAAITDGRAAPEGEDWGTNAAAVLATDQSYVEYDLGRPTVIRAAYLQGDNNDAYIVSLSDDGQSFHEAWTALPVASAGLRERWTDALEAKGRFVRITARGGDGLFALSELQLWSERPTPYPPRISRVVATDPAADVRNALLNLVAAFALFLWATGAGTSVKRAMLFAGLPIVMAAFAYSEIAEAWPLGGREVALVRAVAAALALMALVRQVAPGLRFPARPGAIKATCAVAAVMAVAAFYNLGHPQFWNHAARGPEFVHLPDMRIYQPFAKYFPELRYDGVYVASVLACAEDDRGGSLEALADVPVRDLRTHRSVHARDLTPHVREVRQRFSDARWDAFKRDLAYFRGAMGPDFLTTLTDHGANATPVWVWFARLLFAHTPASETTLFLGGLIDALLILVMAVALARTFGLLPMLVAMTVFGANDLYMFGTDWTGATLRHDWLVALGLAACALARRRWTAAGILIGLATMIRAFPSIALVGVGLPATVDFVEQAYRQRRLPDWRRLLREHEGAVRTIAAALATMLVAFLVTGALYSFGMWGEWLGKVALLNRDTAINEISLRGLVAGTDAKMSAILKARFLIYLALAGGMILLAALTARRRPLHEAMLLALPLVLVFWNPSNYYLHLVFLLVLVTVPGGLLWSAGPFLAMCVASYWTGLDPDTDRHFQDLTMLLFVTLGWFYANALRGKPQTAVGPT
jgi:hypothetical protein